MFRTTFVRLAPEIEQRLDFLAASPGRTKACYLRGIIDRGLTAMEDYYLAAEVLERVRKGHESVHSAADTRKDLGLDDWMRPKRSYAIAFVARRFFRDAWQAR